MVDDAASRAAPIGSSSSREADADAAFCFDAVTTFEWTRRQIAQFADERGWNSETHSPRNLLFALTKELGDLGAVFQWKSDSISVRDWTPADRARLRDELSDVLLFLVLLADKCCVDLPTVAHEKMIKNARKYPPKLTIDPLASPASGSECQDQPPLAGSKDFRFEAASTLELFRRKTVHFADERGWAPNLSPRNLLLALTAEVGELCEIFQWKGDAAAPRAWTPAERVHLGEELSDVLLYLVQLADRSFADLAAGVQDRIIQYATMY